MANENELAQAGAMLNAGRFSQAIGLLERIVARDSREWRALHMLGVARAQAGRLPDALTALADARALQPKFAALLVDSATALIMAQRPEEALPLLQDALKIEPAHAQAKFYTGVALTNLGRSVEALDIFEELARREPRQPLYLQNHAALLLKLERADEAAVVADRLLALAPNAPQGLLLKISTLIARKKFDDAIVLCDAIIARDPRAAEAHACRGAALSGLGRMQTACQSLARAAELRPNHLESHLNLAAALERLGDNAAALAAFDRALALAPDNSVARMGRGDMLLYTGEFSAAAQEYARLLAREPDRDYLIGHLIHARMHVCDWTDFEALQSRLREAIDAGRLVGGPFPLLVCDIGPQRLLSATQAFVRREFPPAAALLAPARAPVREKIRVAYLSGEFREQATAYLAAEIYELHDRDKFEIIGIDTGQTDHSPMRARLESAFGGIRAMTQASDAEIARALVEAGVDIAVNLNGWFGQGRAGVFAMRAAPVQVNFLGFPGSMGAEYMDYIIADRRVIEAGEDALYTEKIVTLPDCYQPNDTRRPLGEPVTRAGAGLPDSAFVFCCFNNTHKISPRMFDIWARLLRAVDHSVLWLLTRNDEAQTNLRREIAARGVAPERLIFAPYLPIAAHIARHRCADLFLDTLPHNAHTTASDALWAGVPVLTCRGETFAGRVADSLLHAVGLPELVTASLEEYEALALRLAREPALLAGLRARLAQNRATCPLFDSRRYVRHLETAYSRMVERSRRGDPPGAIVIEASG